MPIAIFDKQIIRGEGQESEGKLHPEIGSEIEMSCLYCHTGNLQNNKKSLKLSKISCKNCHQMDTKHFSEPKKYKELESIGPKPRYGSCTSCHTNPNNSNELIHANQAVLLPMSKCVTHKVNCQTCHDSHSLKAKKNSCVQCHQLETSSHFKGNLNTCVECHMPQKDVGMSVRTLENKTIRPTVRDHHIKIYDKNN